MSIADTNLKTEAFFDVGEEVCAPLTGNEYSILKDPAGIDVLQRIALGLRGKGYNVTKVKRGKGIHAACIVRLSSSCEIEVLLGVVRIKRGYVSCYLDTSRSRPFFGWFERGEPSDWDCMEQWMKVRDAINDVIVDKLGLPSVEWVTPIESSDRWAARKSAN